MKESGLKEDLFAVAKSLKNIVRDGTAVARHRRQDQTRLLAPPHGEPCIALHDGLSAVQLQQELLGIASSRRLFTNAQNEPLITDEQDLPLVAYAVKRDVVSFFAAEELARRFAGRAINRLQTARHRTSPMTPAAAELLHECWSVPEKDFYRARRDERICERLERVLQRAWNDTLRQTTPRSPEEALSAIHGAERRVYHVTASGNVPVTAYIWREAERVIGRGFARQDQPNIVQIGRSLFVGKRETQHLLQGSRDIPPRGAAEQSHHLFDIVRYLNILARATSYGEYWLDDERFGGLHLRFAWYHDKEMIASGWLHFESDRGEISMPSAFRLIRGSLEIDLDESAATTPFTIFKGADALMIWQARCDTTSHCEHRFRPLTDNSVEDD